MAKITYAKRKALPKDEFVFPAKRAYPIDTIGRARNALARVAQNGSPEEIKKVKAAVHKKYPSIDQKKKK